MDGGSALGFGGAWWISQLRHTSPAATATAASGRAPPPSHITAEPCCSAAPAPTATSPPAHHHAPPPSPLTSKPYCSARGSTPTAEVTE